MIMTYLSFAIMVAGQELDDFFNQALQLVGSVVPLAEVEAGDLLGAVEWRVAGAEVVSGL